MAHDFTIALTKLDELPLDQARWVKVRTWSNGRKDYWDGRRWVESLEKAVVHLGLLDGLLDMLKGRT